MTAKGNRKKVIDLFCSGGTQKTTTSVALKLLTNYLIDIYGQHKLRLE